MSNVTIFVRVKFISLNQSHRMRRIADLIDLINTIQPKVGRFEALYQEVMVGPNYSQAKANKSKCIFTYEDASYDLLFELHSANGSQPDECMDDYFLRLGEKLGQCGDYFTVFQCDWEHNVKGGGATEIGKPVCEKKAKRYTISLRGSAVVDTTVCISAFSKEEAEQKCISGAESWSVAGRPQGVKVTHVHVDRD